MKITKNPDALMTPAAVAERLGVSPITVRSWVAKGWLKSHSTPGGHRRFRWADVETFIAKRNQINSTPNGSSDKILVVDDDPQFRSYLIDALKTLAPDATIQHATDGFEAGITIASFHPTLILLDYAMPGLNGAAVCKLIRSDPTYAETHLVAITGFADAAIQQELLEAGIDLILHKPLPLLQIRDLLDKFDIRALT